MVEETQDVQKTLVAFAVGLLIGGMLVWAFSGPTVNAPEATNEDEAEDVNAQVRDTDSLISSEAIESEDTKAEEVPKTELKVGKGNVVVPDQKASASVKLDSATFPVSEGWIGIREYDNDQLGYILGVVRFSESQDLVPSTITLQRPTSVGSRYAVVVFTEDGDFAFNLAGDVQIDTIFDTFVAK
ncbi:MAG: hypothetical protein ACI9BF_000039 [Candidatus Paceibacteria bacterium]|jgi:hypothetical protein